MRGFGRTMVAEGRRKSDGDRKWKEGGRGGVCVGICLSIFMIDLFISRLENGGIPRQIQTYIDELIGRCIDR